MKHYTAISKWCLQTCTVYTYTNRENRFVWFHFGWQYSLIQHIPAYHPDSSQVPCIASEAAITDFTSVKINDCNSIYIIHGGPKSVAAIFDWSHIWNHACQQTRDLAVINRSRSASSWQSFWSNKHMSRLECPLCTTEAASGLQPISVHTHTSQLKMTHWRHLSLCSSPNHGRSIDYVGFFQMGPAFHVSVRSPRDLSWSLVYRSVKPHDPKFISFDAFPACDGQTDGHDALSHTLAVTERKKTY